MPFRPAHPTPPEPTQPPQPPETSHPSSPSYVTHLFTKLLHAADAFKVHRIVSFSGPPQTHPSLAEEGVTCTGKVPMEQVDSFVCTGAVDVAKLLRASRMGLLEQALMLGGNVLVEEQYVVRFVRSRILDAQMSTFRWKCIIYCSPKFRHDNSFQVHVRFPFLTPCARLSDSPLRSGTQPRQPWRQK
jgi:hypothetical protein